MAERSAEPLAATLGRLKAERDEADARYNEALTALDRALVGPIELTPPPSPIDDRQVTPLNQAWNTLPAPPPIPAGWRGRLTSFIWRIVGPPLERQLTFNSLLVDHVNRSTAALAAAHAAAAATLSALRDHLNATASFHALHMLYLQQITGYVDTKDRDTGGGALVLNASLSGLAENFAKRWESQAARDARYEARAGALEAAQDQIRTAIGVAQQAAVTLKREMERLQAAPAAAVSATTGAALPSPSSAAPRDAFAPSLDAYKYLGFEDQFRGSREAIRARFESYLPLFSKSSPPRAPEPPNPRTIEPPSPRAGDILDVGCGRGEFLDLLIAQGIAARGIDLNHEMAEACRARGLNVTEADAVGYLKTLPDASLAGIFSAQVVEHLQPAYLLEFLELAFHKLRPGGRLVLETLNPACWVAFFESYIRDITHVWPLHPDTLKYLVTASGFARVDVQFRSPVPPEDRLQPVAVPATADTALADMADAFNANVEKLNARLFTHLDYAIVAER
jgi:SAM-dependent methyltransferase